MRTKEEHGGLLKDVVELAAEDGPGMQRSLPELADFQLEENAFQRMDESADGNFYKHARFVHHLDATAREQIHSLYRRLLSPKAKVLDLMASWDSHLPKGGDIALTGLGMVAEELTANPDMFHYVVHDLNRNPKLSFRSGHFDAVVCTSSVEYLVHPVRVFQEVGRVLKNRGIFIATFSTRWFPEKVLSHIEFQAVNRQPVGNIRAHFIPTLIGSQ